MFNSNLCHSFNDICMYVSIQQDIINNIYIDIIIDWYNNTNQFKEYEQKYIWFFCRIE